MKPSPLPRIAALAAAAVVAMAVLLAVFRAYLDPHTVMDLATRLWSCF